jgi:hypothetical protein
VHVDGEVDLPDSQRALDRVERQNFGPAVRSPQVQVVLRHERRSGDGVDTQVALDVRQPLDDAMREPPVAGADIENDGPRHT